MQNLENSKTVKNILFMTKLNGCKVVGYYNNEIRSSAGLWYSLVNRTGMHVYFRFTILTYLSGSL